MSSYRFTRAAADDLTAIFLEGLAGYGLAQADAYHASLTETFEFLADYSRAARFCAMSSTRPCAPIPANRI